MSTGIDDIVDAASVGMSAERLGWARDLMARQVESGRTPSVVAVVLRRGRCVFAEAMGVQGPHGAPLELDHLWPMASVTKPLTATVAMSMVEDGEIGIHQPVADYLAELDEPEDAEILIHHLFTHTMGWQSSQFTGRGPTFVAEGRLPPPPPHRDFATHLFLSMAFDPIRIDPPGVMMRYDNAGYELLAEIVRRLTGGTLDAQMRTRVFGPLDMADSALILDDRFAGRVVTRAAGLPFGPDAPLALEGELLESSDSGAAGAFLTAPDLARFGEMIRRGGAIGDTRILAPSTVRSMTTDQIPGTPADFGGMVIPSASWGYGFTIVQTRPFSYFRGGLVPLGSVLHPGVGGTSFWIDVEHELVGVWFEVLTQVSDLNEPVSGVGQRFQDIVTAAVVE